MAEAIVPSGPAALLQGLESGVNSSLQAKEQARLESMQSQQSYQNAIVLRMQQQKAAEDRAFRALEFDLKELDKPYRSRDQKLKLFNTRIAPAMAALGMNSEQLTEWPDYADEMHKRAKAIIDDKNLDNRGKLKELGLMVTEYYDRVPNAEARMKPLMTHMENQELYGSRLATAGVRSSGGGADSLSKIKAEVLRLGFAAEKEGKTPEEVLTGAQYNIWRTLTADPDFKLAYATTLKDPRNVFMNNDPSKFAAEVWASYEGISQARAQGLGPGSEQEVPGAPSTSDGSSFDVSGGSPAASVSLPVYKSTADAKAAFANGKLKPGEKFRVGKQTLSF